MRSIKRNNAKMCLEGGPKNRKMSPATKIVTCLCMLIYRTGDNKCPFHLYLSLPALIYDLFRNSTEVQRGNWSFRLAGGGGAVGGKTSQNLCYLYNSIRNCCSHASSCRTLMILLLRFDKFTLTISEV